jgi:hypothetical protein
MSGQKPPRNGGKNETGHRLASCQQGKAEKPGSESLRPSKACLQALQATTSLRHITPIIPRRVSGDSMIALISHFPSQKLFSAEEQGEGHNLESSIAPDAETPQSTEKVEDQ